ncbi:Protein of unknown function DUF262 [Salinisphaera shabanensis E1L3A]|uniref:GmrSD restriction endonucleases N-terminal domain-containing protein n=1 Tax=Salinisphaera shabanensis E1L3A TaxID=1033802 RepID=U2EPR6_9GAMM|nr:DUF262 domain-containing protein [Salinisphaera shabanensis]ERJ20057.1 Protein of unknown function DUF262 [Salinisphaera shabanensis E1L3A]
MSDLKTCFKRVDYDLSSLLHFIDVGDIGLPDIQRPFVWKNAKVRDLFDSMYRGFPVGYLLFWENVAQNGSKQIGTDNKQREVPARLIVDGQQRLTSLYAVFRGKTVLDANYVERQIEIAFRPRDGKFDVADAAIRRDPEWIPNISDLWCSGASSWRMVNNFIAKLEEKTALSEEDEERIAHNLDRLFDLQKYPFTALEIAQSVDEEQVADIFVRINSEGVTLNQADFILTLLSVFWDEGRAQLERFCRDARVPSKGWAASPYNHFLEPDPDQLLRVAVALAFNRGRLKSVYQILRGKDPETNEYDAERRTQQFERLKVAQEQVLDITHWHQFFKALIGAGFRSGELVSSNNALLFAYAFYLIGRVRFDISEHSLQKAIGRWFFFSTLTGRYTSSPETVMDGDLARIRSLQTGDAFVSWLDSEMASVLTNDFWQITLPTEFDSSSARNPQLFAFFAAQSRLGAPALFSDRSVADMLDPTVKAKKKALERHHLFPKAWLEAQGVVDQRTRNQMANYALVEWPDNIDISNKAPDVYVPEIRSRFDENDWQRMLYLHALPHGWENMAYDQFLDKRREAMAQIVREGFEKLS